MQFVFYKGNPVVSTISASLSLIKHTCIRTRDSFTLEHDIARMRSGPRERRLLSSKVHSRLCDLDDATWPAICVGVKELEERERPGLLLWFRGEGGVSANVPCVSAAGPINGDNSRWRWRAPDNSMVVIKSRSSSSRDRSASSQTNLVVFQQRSAAAFALILTLIRMIYANSDNKVISLMTAVHISRRFKEIGRLLVSSHVALLRKVQSVSFSRPLGAPLSPDDDDNVSRTEQAQNAASSLWMQAVARTTRVGSSLFIWETNALTQRRITFRSRIRSLCIARRTEDYWRQTATRVAQK